jgi:DNA-binding FrmR family transcriptional regulator
MTTEALGSRLEPRLARVAGQVHGIRRMLRDRRDSIDILNQIEAARSALASVAGLVLADHIETSIAEAVRSRRAALRRRKIRELMKLCGRFCGRGGGRA